MSNNSTGNCIIIFIKYPDKGKVKTRLANDIGIDKATEFYKCFVEDTLSTVQKIDCDKFIYFSPEPDKNKFKNWLGKDLEYFPQQGDNLGQKMENAFQECFSKDYLNALIIGTDSPDIEASLINEAFEKLKTTDAVIGPSYDGGYYLLGFNDATFEPYVFKNIKWSTNHVYPNTIKVLKEKGRLFHKLKKWDDIDTIADLVNFEKKASICFSKSKTYSLMKNFASLENKDK